MLVRPNAPYVLRVGDLEYRNGISPYIGHEVGAQVIQTILKGETIHTQETGVTETFNGIFIKS